jgi:hypothetical protein
VTRVGNAAPTATTTVNCSGTVRADGAYTLMEALKRAPYAQNLLAEPTPQTGTPGPVSLILGSDFAGVNRPARGASETSKTSTTTKTAHAKPSPSAPVHSFSSTNLNSPGFVQARNAGASICSGLPQSNPESGSPP